MPTFRARLWKISSTGTQASLTLPKAAPVGYPLDQLTADGESATAIALQPDGKPVIAANRSGHFDRNLGHGFITGRAVTSMTSADTTYNGTGVTIEDISPAANREQANSVAVQQDGKLVVVGQVDGSWVIVRYTTTGELDPSFGNGGKVVLYLGGSGSAYKVLLDSAGDIYVAGHASNGTTQDFVVMKLIGSVDHDPAIVVRNGGTSTSPVLVNGQTSAINFGTPRVGSSGVTKDFRINNLGNGPLTIDSITVPTGYQITSSVTSVAAGASATLNIKLKANILGTFNGPVTITTNDPAQGVFTFPVTGSVVPNSPPVFKGLTISTVQGIATTISFAKILANTSDANDDPLSIGPLPASTSVGGASLAFTGTDSISYTPPLDLIGVDTFQVLIADGIDKTEGTISVNVTQDPALNPKNPPQLSVNGTTGALTITFSGLPNRTYTIQRSSNLVTWIDLGTAKADKLGAITFTDPSPPQPSAFYRLKL